MAWDVLSRDVLSYIRSVCAPKIAFISLSIKLSMCFGCSKEPSHGDKSHGDGSFEYPQHMFWLSNKKNNFSVRTLIWRPVKGSDEMRNRVPP